LKRIWPFIWTKLNSLDASVICIKFDWNLEKTFKDFSNIKHISKMFVLLPRRTMIWMIFNPHYVRKLSCINMCFSGSVVLEKIFKWPHHIFTFFFFNNLSCEEDLINNLNSFEFLSPKNDLYEVWLKLTRWFWRKRF
jgi:hypothetical protein